MMEKHFTATVYIVRDQKVLLINHNKAGKWLPPGGHLESGEDPASGALREAKEETGLDIELLTQENVWMGTTDVKSFARPYGCCTFPSAEDYAHFHMDFFYAAVPIGGDLLENPLESNGIGWFGESDLIDLGANEKTFAEVPRVAIQILNDLQTGRLIKMTMPTVEAGGHE